MNMTEMFHTDLASRDKFLSRLFGIFSEEIVRIWCRSPESRYEDIGRPTVTSEGEEGRGSTLDFCLRDRTSGKLYVSEMKCELEYQGYRYLTLTSSKQLHHHSKVAFQRFIGVAAKPGTYAVKVQGNPVSVSGAVLIWGSVSDDGRRSVTYDTRLFDVLSLEEIIRQLRHGHGMTP